MGLLRLLAAKRVKAEVEKGARVFTISTCLYLMKFYKTQYDYETAIGLSAAVANTLFGLAPANQLGVDFLAANAQLVDQKLREIASDSKICGVVSICVYIKTNAAGAEAMFAPPILRRALKAGLSPELLKWTVKMEGLGILRPAEQIQWPSSLEDFYKHAREFELWVMQQPDYITIVHATDEDVRVTTNDKPQPHTAITFAALAHSPHAVNIIWCDSEKLPERHAAIVRLVTKIGLHSLCRYLDGEVSYSDLGLQITDIECLSWLANVI